MELAYRGRVWSVGPERLLNTSRSSQLFWRELGRQGAKRNEDRGDGVWDVWEENKDLGSKMKATYFYSEEHDCVLHTSFLKIWLRLSSKVMSKIDRGNLETTLHSGCGVATAHGIYEVHSDSSTQGDVKSMQLVRKGA